MEFFSHNRQKIYWIQSVFRDHLGEGFKLNLDSENESVELTHENSKILVVFENPNRFFMMTRSDIPCSSWNADADGWGDENITTLLLPGYDKISNRLISYKNNRCVIKFDLPGLVFWMLNRIEEIDFTNQDKHERFKATQSHAYLNNYLDRPIVDEWFYILRRVIETYWPEVSLNYHNSKSYLSHDVDHASRYGFSTPLFFASRILGDIKKMNYPSYAMKSYFYTRNKGLLHPKDPYNTFDWLMEQSEKYNLKSTFFFIASLTNHALDGRYDIFHPAIENLLKKINIRGHKIGLHPSYESFLNNTMLFEQRRNLKDLLFKLGVKNNTLYSRMHYLRWKVPDTLIRLDSVGLDYDCTLGYHDMVGFRCGTSHEFQGFDPISSSILNIRMRPLIVMDSSLFNKSYMCLKHDDEVIKVIKRLKNKCFQFGGNFSMLWHNSTISSQDKKNFYSKLLSSLFTAN